MIVFPYGFCSSVQYTVLKKLFSVTVDITWRSHEYPFNMIHNFFFIEYDLPYTDNFLEYCLFA
jgi:hypothetical protein